MAAEKGSPLAAQVLIDAGISTGVFDVDACSTMSYLIEKCPVVAYRALEQYTLKKRLTQCEVYLAYLEPDVLCGINSGEAVKAKSPLEVITANNDHYLIMHPVIQKCIETKWDAFGRKDTICESLVVTTYLTSWLVLAYMFSDHEEFYFDNKGEHDNHSWKIIFELIICVSTIYFFYKHSAHLKRLASHQHQWNEWKIRRIRSRYITCHPAWPLERQSLLAEEEEVIGLKQPTSNKRTFWYSYECLNVTLLCLVIFTRVLVISADYGFLAHKVIFAVSMVFAFIRALNILKRSRYVSVFLHIAFSAVTSFVQITLLYMQFYIPFVLVFWLMFESYGDDEVRSNPATTHLRNSTVISTSISNDTKRSLSSMLLNLDFMFYGLYKSSYGLDGSIAKLESIDSDAFHILQSLFNIAITFLILPLIIAFITSKFTSNYEQCVAHASLEEARYLIQLQRDMNCRDRLNMVKYYQTFCNPLTVNENPLKQGVYDMRNARERLTRIKSEIEKVADCLCEVDGRMKKNAKTNSFEEGYSASVMPKLLCDLTLMSKTTTSDLNNLTSKEDKINSYLSDLLRITK